MTMLEQVAERGSMTTAAISLVDMYRALGQGEEAVAYVTTPVFPGGAPDAAGFDLVQSSVDASLWVALLAPEGGA